MLSPERIEEIRERATEEGYIFATPSVKTMLRDLLAERAELLAEIEGVIDMLIETLPVDSDRDTWREVIRQRGKAIRRRVVANAKEIHGTHCPCDQCYTDREWRRAREAGESTPCAR